MQIPPAQLLAATSGKPRLPRSLLSKVRLGVAYCTHGCADKINTRVIVLGDDGSGEISGVIAGINWAAQQAKASGRRSVANMSLGGPANCPLNTAVKNAIKGGLSFSIAAGNEGQDAKNTSPAGVPGANTVGAVDDNNRKAVFSNFGSSVDVWAPGVGILSAWNKGPNSAMRLDGTSMAAYVQPTITLVFRKAYIITIQTSCGWVYGPGSW